MKEVLATLTAVLDKLWPIFMGGYMVYMMYDALFRQPRKARKKAAALLERIKAQAQGVEKMCGADKKLRELMEKKGPLSPQDPELQAILQQLAEGEKQFRENSGLATSKK